MVGTQQETLIVQPMVDARTDRQTDGREVEKKIKDEEAEKTNKTGERDHRHKIWKMEVIHFA